MQTEAELEAVKCIRIAERAWEEDDCAKALRFAEKAQRLHSSAQAQSLIVKLRTGMKAPPRVRTASERVEAAEDSATARRNENAKPYTSEQAELCSRVMAAKTLYDVLSITPQATDDQIKKAYRKLARLLHPDKNNAPRAEDAFKRISTAFQILSDEGARARYDQTGSAEPESMSSQHFRGGQQFGGQFMTPEDLFANFFFPGSTIYTSRHTQHQRGGGRPFSEYRQRPNQTPENTAAQRRIQGLIQLIPVLLVLLFSFLSHWSNSGATSQPDYSLTRTSATQREMRTRTYDLPYFSSGSRFDAAYPVDSRKRAEAEAEIEYFYSKQRCDRVTQTQKREYEHARAMGTRRRIKSAYEALARAEADNEMCKMSKEIRQKYPVAANRVDSRKSDLYDASDPWRW